MINNAHYVVEDDTSVLAIIVAVEIESVELIRIGEQRLGEFGLATVGLSADHQERKASRLRVSCELLSKVANRVKVVQMTQKRQRGHYYGRFRFAQDIRSPKTFVS